jgi:deazaflavin-dependent oxidoreductase (nitroreductase family)
MADDLATQLKRVAGNQTLQLVHQGRKSGKSCEVTIWFMVEGEAVFLVTSNSDRQWVRNILVRPGVTLRAAGQSFTGKAEPISDEAGRAHVMALVGKNTGTHGHTCGSSRCSQAPDWRKTAGAPRVAPRNRRSGPGGNSIRGELRLFRRCTQPRCGQVGHETTRGRVIAE